MRFKAPPHVSSAHLSIGELTVDENGCIEVPLGTPTTDIGGLCANGFMPAAPEEPESIKLTAAAKGKPALDLTPADEAVRD